MEGPTGAVNEPPKTQQETKEKETRSLRVGDIGSGEMSWASPRKKKKFAKIVLKENSAGGGEAGASAPRRREGGKRSSTKTNTVSYYDSEIYLTTKKGSNNSAGAMLGRERPVVLGGRGRMGRERTGKPCGIERRFPDAGRWKPNPRGGRSHL